MKAWYPHFPGDYARDTAHLSIVQHGAYRLLLDHYYASGKPLPADVSTLYRVCRAFDDFERGAVDFILSQFFQLQADGYHNGRADRQLVIQAEEHERHSYGARKTNAQRWGNHRLANRPANRLAVANPEPEPEPEPEPDKDKDNTSRPSDGGVAVELLSYWNENRGTLPEALRLTKSRTARITTRLKEDPQFAETFKRAVLKAKGTPFCCGSGTRAWRVTFDWLIGSDKNCLAVLEGKYDAAETVPSTPPRCVAMKLTRQNIDPRMRTA